MKFDDGRLTCSDGFDFLWCDLTCFFYSCIRSFYKEEKKSVPEPTEEELEKVCLLFQVDEIMIFESLECFMECFIFGLLFSSEERAEKNRSNA